MPSTILLEAAQDYKISNAFNAYLAEWILLKQAGRSTKPGRRMFPPSAGGNVDVANNMHLRAYPAFKKRGSQGLDGSCQKPACSRGWQKKKTAVISITAHTVSSCVANPVGKANTLNPKPLNTKPLNPKPLNP